MNPLENRRLILCEASPPNHCIMCEKPLPAKEERHFMMINIDGEAVVCPGPVQLCEHCEAAYVHEQYYSHVASKFEFDPYTLVGFVDMDSLTPEQRNQPLGEDPDQEIPLKEFIAVQALKPAKFN